MRKKSLLIVAHGSRREASNEEVRQLTNRLRCEIEHKQLRKTAYFEQINCAFLELATPSIPQGIDNCCDRDITEVIVFPYFLSAGRHVAQDIPQIIATKQSQYPNIRITLNTHLGKIEGLTALILKRIL